MTIRRYAEGTTVSVENSRNELTKLLERYGAEQFMYGQDGSRTVIQFKMAGYYVQRSISRPSKATMAKGYRGSDSQLELAVDKEWRRRWRALVMIIKAKLEMIASEESTVLREFMPDILIGDGRRLEEHMAPQLEQGKMPKLLMPGDPAGGPQ